MLPSLPKTRTEKPSREPTAQCECDSATTSGSSPSVNGLSNLAISSWLLWERRPASRPDVYQIIQLSASSSLKPRVQTKHENLCQLPAISFAAVSFMLHRCVLVDLH